MLARGPGDGDPGFAVRHVDAPAPVASLAAALGELVEERRPDVIHTHSWSATLAALVGGVPVVVSAHTPPPEQAAGLVAKVAQVLAPTEEGAHRLGRRSGVRVVPYGVDAEAFRPEGPTLRRADHPRLVCVDRLGPGSGVPDLLAALRYVPGAELLVAGGPPTDDPAVDPADDRDLARLHGTARELGVERRVRFLGAVARETLPVLLRSADAVVHAPRVPGTGTGVLEAMACGRPVVCGTAGAGAEAVVEEVTGVLLDAGDPVALGTALYRLLGDRPRREAFGIAARRRVLSRYAWPQVAAEVEGRYAAAGAMAEPVP
jgi:glycosyltransferase involved in cell wall biosynthesis